MAPRVVQRHDQFFQALLDKPGTAGALIRENLPREITARLSSNPPVLMPGSFVSSELRGVRTDRLYRCWTIDDRPVLIYTILEHKSTNDPRIALQILTYICRIIEYWDKTEGRATDGTLNPLPAIVTMVVYNGTAPWTVPLSLAEATDADPALLPYLPNFRYSLVDLGRVPNEQLSQLRALRVGLLILKHGKPGRARSRRIAQNCARSLGSGL